MAHWRHTFQPVKFFFMDVRFGIIILASFMYIRWWTMTLDLLLIILAWYIERNGLGFMGALRAIRCHLAGRVRPPLPRHKIRAMIDYQRRPLPWEKPSEIEKIAFSLDLDPRMKSRSQI